VAHPARGPGTAPPCWKGGAARPAHPRRRTARCTRPARCPTGVRSSPGREATCSGGPPSASRGARLDRGPPGPSRGTRSTPAPAPMLALGVSTSTGQCAARGRPPRAPGRRASPGRMRPRSSMPNAYARAEVAAASAWMGLSTKTRTPSPRLQRRQKALRAADQGNRSRTRANGWPFPHAALEMLPGRFGASGVGGGVCQTRALATKGGRL
jgi:hypothetical protein